MNISLTILCVIAVLFAVVAAFLGRDDVENGVIFPWQIVASCAIGFLITHGQYYLTTYAWMYERLMGDGVAGMVLSAVIAFFVEAGVAGLTAVPQDALHRYQRPRQTCQQSLLRQTPG